MKKFVQYQFILVGLALMALFYVLLKPPEYVERDTNIVLDVGEGDTVVVTPRGTSDEDEEETSGDTAEETAPLVTPEPTAVKKEPKDTPTLRPDPDMSQLETTYQPTGENPVVITQPETIIR